MYKCIKNFKIIISCILILSLAVGFITLRNFVSAGTQNNEGVLGLKKAIEFINDIGSDNIHEYEMELHKYALEK